MSIEVDGFAVIRRIAERPDVFSDITAEMNKAARAFVGGQLKAKTTTLTKLRAVHAVIGDEAFALILDGLGDATVNALVKKLDKDHPEIATAPAKWRLQHIRDLARSAAEPAAKAPKAKAVKEALKEKAAKPARTPKPKVERALNSKAMAAKWDGKDRDG